MESLKTLFLFGLCFIIATIVSASSESEDEVTSGKI